MDTPDVGDWIFVVYWQPFPLQTNPDNGSWEVVNGQLISTGAKRVAFEVSNPSVLGEGAPANSTTRFSPKDRVFSTYTEAADMAKVMPPPPATGRTSLGV